MASAIAKPPFGARLRRGDKLAAKLAAFWMFNGGRGSLAAKDSVSNGIYDLAISNLSTFSWISGTDGMSLNRSTAINSDRLIPNKTINTGTTFTFAARLFLLGGSSFAPLFAQATTIGCYVRVASGNKLDLQNPADTLSTTGLVTNAWSDIVVSCLAGNARYYIHGVKDATTVSGVPSIAVDCLSADSASDRLGATFAYMAFWLGRSLNQQEVNDLRFDPYRMFRRQRIGNPLHKATGGLLLRRRKAMAAA